MANTIRIGTFEVSSFKVGLKDPKIYLGDILLYPTGGYKVCYAVVDDITQYQETEFEDVYDKATEKWYKLNNLDEYEQYGVYGDSIATSGSSRLPQGYTEVEYVENTTSAYLNLGINPTNAIGNSFTIETKFNSSPYGSNFEYIFSNEQGNASPYYGFGLRWYQRNIQVMTSDETNYTSAITQNSDSTSSFTFSVSSASRSNTTPITLFCGLQGSTVWRNGRGKFYSFKLTLNNTLVRDLVPCKRDSDSMVGLYDIVNDVFYYPPNYTSYQLVAGSAVTPTAATYYQGKLAIVDGYEYMYSGSSWVNVGEVSGGTIDTVWIDPPSTNNQNASFDIGHYWGEGYKMVFNAYLSGSYSGDYGSFWRWNQHTPIEFNFYSNGFYYDFHNPTSTSEPNVYTGDSSWRIMKNNTLINYENSQIFNVILTNGTVSVKLEETGAEIVNGSTSVSTQSWYNGLYQASLGSMNNQSKCHLSHIQVYNANDELVNDIKFVKNQGVTGAQEISAYDSVLNVTYNNTNSYTPVYHVVEESGGTTYPMYYDEMQDPPNNVSFSSMTEAEEYECPWVGMTATIDGVRYVFSGDSQSGYEWVLKPSRLPDGYTEVEYIRQNSNYNAYINTGVIIFDNTTNTYTITTKLTSEFHSNIGCATIISCERVNSPYDGLGYRYKCSSTVNQLEFFGGHPNYTSSVVDNGDGTRTVTFQSSGNSSFTTDVPLSYMAAFSSTTYGANASWRHSDSTIYSATVVKNGVTVRDFVPAKRDSDSVYGLYDLITDTFYTSPNGNNFIGGDPV